MVMRFHRSSFFGRSSFFVKMLITLELCGSFGSIFSLLAGYTFYFWSFEICGYILRNQKKIIGLDSYILNSLSYLNLIWIYMSHCMTSLLKLEITVWLFGVQCQFIQGH